MNRELADVLAVAANVAVAIPVAVVFVETVAALWPERRREYAAAASPARVAVLVPAHNEETAIQATLRDIRSQLAIGDRIIVVADNCSDDTAALARQGGAEVLERRDEVRRGKGFALAHGLEHLKAQPPDLVVFVDADTHVAAGSIAALRGRVMESAGPVQAVYLLDIPADAGPTAGISAFAFLVKNLVRPVGGARLGIPCQLLGTGMAMPWGVIDIQRLATGNIVEDMQLGVDLAIRGRPPRLCLEARVTGSLPAGRQAALIQRTRWEHGHLGTLLTQVPRLTWHGLSRLRPSLLGMALDLAVPPLALLCMIWLLVAGASSVLAWRGLSGIPAWIAACTGASIGLTVLLAWARHARGVIPGRVLAFAPFYALWKIPLYVAFIFRRQKDWVRTPREHPSGTMPRQKPPGPEGS